MTLYIIIATAVISLIGFTQPGILSKLMFNPYSIAHRNEWYRFITSGFIHADWMHLLINMFVLYSFGQAVEFYYHTTFPEHGSYYFILLYAGALIISVAPTYAKHKNNAYYNALGASGAVSAVLFAAIIFNPLSPIYIYGLIKLPGIIVGAAYLFYEYSMGKKQDGNINHDAHLWGAIFGMLFTISLKPSLIIDFFSKLTDF